MRLFLVAVLPLTITVLVQASIGIGKIRVIAVASLVGSIVNLPLSYWLTVRIGVAGVIWGTVLTTLVSNLLVPGIYTFRVLEVRPMTFLAVDVERALGGGGCIASDVVGPEPGALARSAGRREPPGPGLAFAGASERRQPRLSHRLHRGPVRPWRPRRPDAAVPPPGLGHRLIRAFCRGVARAHRGAS